MAWLLVIVAGLFETGFAVLLKQSNGITRIYRLWRLTSRPDKANWYTAERVRDTLTQEPAYFRWINRGQPLWDSLADWHEAERELGTG